MLIIVKPEADPKKVEAFKKEMTAQGLIIQDIQGPEVCLLQF